MFEQMFQVYLVCVGHRQRTTLTEEEYASHHSGSWLHGQTEETFTSGLVVISAS